MTQQQVLRGQKSHEKIIQLRVKQKFSKMMKYVFSGLKITNKISTWKQFIIHCATGLIVGSCGVTAIIKSPFECIMLFRQGFTSRNEFKSDRCKDNGDETGWSRESGRSWYIVGNLEQYWKAICTKLADQYDSGLLSSLKTIQFRPLETYSFPSQAIHFLIQGPFTLVDRPDVQFDIWPSTFSHFDHQILWTVHFDPRLSTLTQDRPFWLNTVHFD